MEPDFLAVAYVKRAVGLKGEVEIEVLTDFPSRFKQGVCVFIDPPHRDFSKLSIETFRRRKGKFLLKFKEVKEREEAKSLCGRFLKVSVDEAHPLPEGSYWHHQIIGLDVVTTEGKFLGKVEEILKTGSNDVYIVKFPTRKKNQKSKEVLIPATREVIKQIDLEKKKIIVELLPGLLD